MSQWYTCRLMDRFWLPFTNAPGHKVYRPIKVNPLDAGGSEKWESKHRLDDLYVRWIGEPLCDLLVKIFERWSRR
ncbi:MAG: hypothetical protein RL710_2666 [Pseudomonadota bacterium]